MEKGTSVEVRTRFDGRWVSGFTVAEMVSAEPQGSLRLRRGIDGTVLPAVFPPEDVRLPRSQPR
jgi:hypothetical protein